jgi:hypothetical protein
VIVEGLADIERINRDAADGKRSIWSCYRRRKMAVMNNDISSMLSAAMLLGGKP